jgi:hypothetical protein
VVWLSKYNYAPLVIMAILLLVLVGLPFLLWGIFFRVTIGLHVTWMGQFSNAFLGKPTVRSLEFRRGVAQQSSCQSDIGAPRARVV